ncbi:transglutaminase domain-containing protein [Lacinutrix sp. Bg11-31]|uniref:transglutaminase domain-containing protein n=1 Tax=Lacinutrix sp. Bg11-31 TaxID=2057808 RepID=UPI000C319670|nr:transglutaminase domain-containing protein [Lacinutrix sp. Bg11-31]AUC83537.1 transglutaminase [Lacinutrix sp. Bg11-31]
MKKTVLIIALLLAQLGFSQDFKFGKVSKAELEETQHALEPDADAAVLYRSQNISFDYVQEKGFVQKNEIQERIKIYNKDGYDYATKTIKLYDEGNDTKDKLISFKAYTYNLNNGKIVESKLKKDGIFEEKTNRYWKKTKFTMPNVGDGCIIEYRYTVVSQLLGIDDIAFQELLPINKLDFKVSTPEYFKYKALLNPKAAYLPKLNKTVRQSSFSINETSRTSPVGINQGSNTETSFNKSKIDYKSDIISSNLTNIPALKNEVLVDNLSNYQAKLVMELHSIEYPNQPTKSFSRTWEDVTESIYKNEDFGKQLNKDYYFQKDVDAILSGLTTPEEKISAIYNYVKSKVKSNGLIGYYSDLGVSKAYKEGVGNVADINLMLVAMLRYSGLQANPVLVSTRSNGVPITATKTGFNYVIAAVELMDKVVLLDASNKFSTANVLPKNLLNWQGRLIRENDSSKWINLQPSQASKQIIFLNATINEDLSINGKAREQLTNHLALAHREEFNAINNEDHILSIEEGKGDIKVSNIDVKSKDELSKPILISYEYSLQNGIEEIADKLYFSSMLFFAQKENPFKQETREYPVDFAYPISEKHVINIKIPQGYQVESIPESAKIQYNLKDAEFTYAISHKNDLIQIITNLDINKSIILPVYYQDFKKFFDLVIKKETEQIVLKKM